MKQPAKNPPFSAAGFMDFVGIYKTNSVSPAGRDAVVEPRSGYYQLNTPSLITK